MNPLRERLLITLIRANRKQGFSTAQLYKPSLRLFVGRVTFSFPYVNGGGHLQIPKTRLPLPALPTETLYVGSPP